MIKDIMAEEGMRYALNKKLLISICAGTTAKQIEEYIYGQGTFDISNRCEIVRAMPNTASAIGQSMTVVATSTPPLPEETTNLITWIFTRIGEVVYLPASNVSFAELHG
jgi:pyrroline-5-carboxylate reductase